MAARPHISSNFAAEFAARAEAEFAARAEAKFAARAEAEFAARAEAEFGASGFSHLQHLADFVFRLGISQQLCFEFAC